MPDTNIVFIRFLIVSFGAVIGTWVRFVFVRYSKLFVGTVSRGTVLVNICASFSLGLCISIDPLSFQKPVLPPLA